MKTLISAACIMVLLCGGYYLFSQWAFYEARKQDNLDRKGAEAELFELAKAKPHEVQKVKAWCKVTTAGGLRSGNELLDRWIENCWSFGYAN